MKNLQCPNCGKNTYEEWEGEYDIPDESGAKKLSPDTGKCSSCGFSYSEHIEHPLEEQVKNFKEKVVERKLLKLKRQNNDKNRKTTTGSR